MWPVSLMESQIFNSVLQLLHAQTIRYPLLILHEEVDYFLMSTIMCGGALNTDPPVHGLPPWTTPMDCAAEV